MSSLDELSARLDRLEREARRLYWIGVAVRIAALIPSVLLLIAFVFVWPQGELAGMPPMMRVAALCAYAIPVGCGVLAWMLATNAYQGVDA